MKRKGIISAGLIFAALVGIACDGEEEPFTDNEKNKQVAAQCDPKKVPKDKANIGQKRYVTVYGCVEKEYAPVELYFNAHDTATGERKEHNELGAGHEVTYHIGYDTGHLVQIYFRFQPSRAGSKKGILWISDGVGNRRLMRLEGATKIETRPDDFFLTAR